MTTRTIDDLTPLTVSLTISDGERSQVVDIHQVRLKERGTNAPWSSSGTFDILIDGEKEGILYWDGRQWIVPTNIVGTSERMMKLSPRIQARTPIEAETELRRQLEVGEFATSIPLYQAAISLLRSIVYVDGEHMKNTRTAYVDHRYRAAKALDVLLPDEAGRHASYPPDPDPLRLRRRKREIPLSEIQPKVLPRMLAYPRKAEA